MNPRISLKGQRFTHLRVLKYLGRRSGQSDWWCECDCGVRKQVLYNALTTGRTTSCGCGLSRPLKNKEP